MRLAAFSDMHGNMVAFEAALADYEKAGGADTIWFLGDYAAFGPRPAECVRRVKAFLDEIEGDETRRGTRRAIRGNTDRYLVTGQRHAKKAADNAEKLQEHIEDFRAEGDTLVWGLEQLSFEEYEFLAKLSGECSLTADGYGHVIGYHGTPGDDEGYLQPDTDEEKALDALLDREGVLGIGAHIHVQMDRTLREKGRPSWRAINIGSVGMSNDKPGYAEWGLFTFEDGKVEVDLRAVPYDLEAVIADLKMVGYPAPEWGEKKFREKK